MEIDAPDHQSRLRPITSELNLISRPDGSTAFHQGETSVLTAVYGPADVKMNKEIIHKATVEVIYKPKSGLPGCPEKFQEDLLRSTLETVILASAHPRTSITIVVQEMQNSGSFLACCINAACLALLDAGVPMRFTVAAVGCMLDEEGQIILDPTLKQAKDAETLMTFAFDSIDNTVISVTTTGVYSQDIFQQCLSACKEASKEVFEFYRAALKRKLARTG